MEERAYAKDKMVLIQIQRESFLTHKLPMLKDYAHQVGYKEEVAKGTE
jgi:hypothetical protein